MTALAQSLKFALRLLWKNPGFTAAAIIVMALGIGANTAIFSVVNAVLLRPLPYKDPARLVQLWHVPPQASFPGMTTFAVSPANFLDWQRQNEVFEKTALVGGRGFNLTGTGRPEALHASTVTDGFFDVFGVKPIWGRTFLPEEDQAGKNREVVLSYPLWRDRFASDRKAVGRQIELNGEAYSIIGVMGPAFRYPDWAQFWTPMAMTDKEKAVRSNHNDLAIARLKPTVDVKQAQAEMNTISRRLEEAYPEDDKGWGASVVPLREQEVGEVRTPLLMLLGAVAFVLLIACANVANLVLARTLARKKEIAIRTALGATRSQAMRQVLLEPVVLSLCGGALGLSGAHFGIQLIIKFFGDKLPRGTEIGFDGQVLAFTFAVAILTGILSGILPALRLTHADINDALKQGLGRTDSDAGGLKTRNALVVCEVALSLVLLAGAGLMIRSLRKLESVDPGFDVHHVLTMSLKITRDQFAKPEQQGQFFDQVLQRVRALPGIESAGVIDNLPLSGGSNQPFAIEGHPAVQMSEQPEVAVRTITPGYLQGMKIRLLKGRDLTDADSAKSPWVVLISESMAKRFWGNENPVGRHLTLTFFPQKPREIAGVVADVKQEEMEAQEAKATLYFPINQVSAPAAGMGEWSSFPMSLVVRTAGEPGGSTSAVTNAIHQVDKDVPLADVLPLEQYVEETAFGQRRFSMLLLTTFAALALVLASIGIYSVLAYSVRRRVREIGIRMALGASIRDLVRMVVLQGMKPTLLGVVIGIVAAFALGRVVKSLVYGVSSSDAATFLGVSLILLSTGFFASLIPAYRVAQVEPVKTLREE